MLGKIHLRPYETRSFVNVNIIVTFHRLPLFGILAHLLFPLKKMLMENYVSRAKCQYSVNFDSLFSRGFGSSQKKLTSMRVKVKILTYIDN